MIITIIFCDYDSFVCFCISTIIFVAIIFSHSLQYYNDSNCLLPITLFFPIIVPSLVSLLSFIAPL